MKTLKTVECLVNLTTLFAVLLCVIAHVFVDAADKVYTKEVKALKDKQTK